MRIRPQELRDGVPHHPWLQAALAADRHALDLPRLKCRLLACALRQLWHLKPKERTRDELRLASRAIALRHGAPDFYEGVDVKWMQRRFQRITDVARGWEPNRLAGRTLPAGAGAGLTHKQADALRRELAAVREELRDARDARGVQAMADFRAAMGIV